MDPFSQGAAEYVPPMRKLVLSVQVPYLSFAPINLGSVVTSTNTAGMLGSGSYVVEGSWEVFEHANSLELVLPSSVMTSTGFRSDGYSSYHVTENASSVTGYEIARFTDRFWFKFDDQKMTIEVDDKFTPKDQLKAIKSIMHAAGEIFTRPFVRLLVDKATRSIKGFTPPQHHEHLGFSATMMLLCVPILQEIGSSAALYNMTRSPHTHEESDVNDMMLTDLPRVKFSECFRQYVGGRYPSLQKLAGKLLTQGFEYRRVDFSAELSDLTIANHVQKLSKHCAVLRVERDRVTMLGDRYVTPQVFWFIKTMLESLPVDHVRTLLESAGPEEVKKIRQYSQSTYTPTDRMPDFLSRFPVPTRLKIMQEWPSMYEMSDTERQLREFGTPESIPAVLRSAYPEGLKPPRKWQTFKELHDKISKAYTEIKAEANNRSIAEVYEKTPHMAALDGQVVGDLKMTLPRETRTLVEWGRKLSICISSYGDKAGRGECVLVGFYRGDDIVYAMELPPVPEPVGEVESVGNIYGIRYKTGIRQLVKQDNKPVEEPDRGLIVAKINELAAAHKATQEAQTAAS